MSDPHDLSPALRDAIARARLPLDVRPERLRAAQDVARRPFYSVKPLITAAAIVLLLSGVWLRQTREEQLAVTFAFNAPAAQRVTVVGDFNDWNPAAAPLQRRKGGTWSATLELPPGHYTYAFVVNDSIWYADPSELVRAPSDFGRPSSVRLVSKEAS